MRFSASRCKKWMACPLQAHFHYDLNLPTKQNAKATFGTCIHHALELYNKTGSLDAAIEDFKTYWHSPEKLGVAPDTWPKMTSYAGLRERGIEILKTFHDNCKWDGREVIATEHPFLVPFGRHELTGYVDLLEIRTSGRGKNLLRIVDYKTNSKQPYLAELHLDLQFTVYCYASLQPEFWMGNGPQFPAIPNGEFRYEMLKDMKRRPIWFHLWGPKELDAGDRDEADFMRLYRLVNEIEKADAAGIHIPRIGEACGLCDYNEPCGTPIPKREEIAEDQDSWI